ncbi:MAG: HEAT repeat domain-containing protein [Planctomycetota bacterium]
MNARPLLRLFSLGLFLVATCFSSNAAAQEATDPNADLLKLVVELLNDSDKDMRAVGLEQVRTELKGEAATKQLLALLPKLNAGAQASLVAALGDRGDATAKPELLKMIKDESAAEGIRAAAIQAVSALGSEADAELLVGLLAAKSEELSKTAQTSLAKLPGAGTSKVLAALMEQQKLPQRIVLMDVLVARKASDAVPGLLAAALDENAELRGAAVKALGQLASADNLPGLVAAVLKAESGKEREAAEKAVMFVCQRSGGPDDRCKPLLAAVKQLSDADQLQLLSTVGRVGGKDSLEVIGERIASSNPREHELGIRALCNWPDATVAGQLRELMAEEDRPELDAMLLAALIRIAPLPDQRTPAERLALLEQVMQLCSKDGERNQVLKRAPAIRTIETLRFVIPYLDQPALAAQAQEAVVELAHHRNLREPNKEEFAKVLDRVQAESKDDIVRDRAQRYKNGQTWDRKSVGR